MSVQDTAQPEKGKAAPDFCLPDSNGQSICLKDLRGQWIVLYFYPKDNTSGCTLEAVTFTEQIAEFQNLNATVLGVSPDSEKSHCNFRDRHGLKVTLLSDPKHDVLEKYGVWISKKMYGRESMGVERSTVLIDPKGVIAAVWRKVKVKGHAEEVLHTLKEQR